MSRQECVTNHTKGFKQKPMQTIKKYNSQLIATLHHYIIPFLFNKTFFSKLCSKSQSFAAENEFQFLSLSDRPPSFKYVMSSHKKKKKLKKMATETSENML